MTFRVMHLIDSLAAGGAERVAVNLANGLHERGHRVILCATRTSGSLRSELLPEVQFACLDRRTFLDPVAMLRLVKLIRANDIQILHAHSTSIFIATMAGWLLPQLKIVWHDHFGLLNHQERSPFLYRLAVGRGCGVIAVNQDLAGWSAKVLGVPAGRIWYLPNFVSARPDLEPALGLPGQPGFRLVCVANLRPQKDHLTLLRAMSCVCQLEPRAHLFLVGSENDRSYAASLWQEVEQLGIRENITWLGPRQDVQSVLKSCDVGLLSSASEGLPLSLLEYGLLGLAVVCTRVGECPSVLEEGQAGLLVEPGDPAGLAQAILRLLVNPNLRLELGDCFQAVVRNQYSQDAVIPQVEAIYTRVLS